MKRKFLASAASIVFLTLLVSAISPAARSDSRLTGDHEDLNCSTCHDDPHKPQIDRTICQTCHGSKWNLVQEGSHQGGSAPFDDYCATCHDPHHPDYFWNLTKQDWIPRDAPESEINKLCYQCHTFSPEEFAQISDYHSASITSEPAPPAPPLLPPLNLSLVLVLEIIIIAATIVLSKIRRPRQKSKREALPL